MYLADMSLISGELLPLEYESICINVTVEIEQQEVTCVSTMSCTSTLAQTGDSLLIDRS